MKKKPFDIDKIDHHRMAGLLNLSTIQFDSHEQAVSMLGFVKGFVANFGEDWVRKNRAEVLGRWEAKRQLGLKEGRREERKRDKKNKT